MTQTAEYLSNYEDLQINEYLYNYEDLWREVAQHEPELPIMDPAMDMIDEPDYYGYDFTGDKSVYMLFFTGQSNYFPGIHVKKGDKIDQSPIYIFDLQSDQKPLLIGNFKTYMKKLLDDFISNYHLDGQNSQQSYIDYFAMAKQALLELEQFSDTLCRHDDFNL